MKTKSGKTIKSLFATVALLGLGMNTVAAPQANAGLLLWNSIGIGVVTDAMAFRAVLAGAAGLGIASLGMQQLDFNPNWEPGVVLLSLGVVILDKKVAVLPRTSEEELMDNGYTIEQADNILNDWARLNSKLAAEKKLISLSKGDTQSKIHKDLAAFMSPDLLSDEFLDWYSKRLAFLAQREPAPDHSGITGNESAPSSMSDEPVATGISAK